MVSSLFEYRTVQRNREKLSKNVDNDVIAKRETEYYEKNIKKAKNVDDLLNDSKLYRYIMQAYGLSDVMYAKGMVRKILTDPDYAARVKDPKFKKLQENFNFKVFKDTTTSLVGATTETIGYYKEMVLEAKVGKINENSRLALYFNRVMDDLIKNKKLKESSWPYMILSDRTLTELAFKAMGASDNALSANVDLKVSLLKKHFSLKDFTDKDLREKVVTKALIKADLASGAGNAYSSGATALQLLQDCSSDVMFGISNIPHGGY